MEVCDAAIGYVEEHLAEVGEAFLPGGRWCPWGSALIEEVQFPMARLEFMAICVETADHGGNEYALIAWLTSEVEANDEGKKHEQDTNGHR